MIDYLDTGCDPDELSAPPGRCEGDGYRGCGRFLKVGDWICPRCRAAAGMDAIITDVAALEDAYWASREGQALIAADRARVAAYDETGPDLEDLPF
jgi:hypothetical protein